MKINRIKEKLNEIIFGTETKLGKRFDMILIVLIILSIIAVMLESVEKYQQQFGQILTYIEWAITLIFTAEYLIRLWIVPSPFKFFKSFFGIIDLLSFLPTYIAVFVSGTQGLIVIRALRLLRIFRVLKLNRYVNESSFLWNALKAARIKISIFLYAVIMLVIIIGAAMYLIEGEVNGFDSIPRSMYWVIVTITTVGFGDITPSTTAGQFLASFIMILGYAIIAVPTGIVTAEIGRLKSNDAPEKTRTCNICTHKENNPQAKFCKICGLKFNS